MQKTQLVALPLENIVIKTLKTKRLLQRCSGVSVAQFVRAAVELEKEQKIKASLKTFFAVFDRLSIASIALFGCVEMRTKRLLRRCSGVSVN